MSEAEHPVAASCSCLFNIWRYLKDRGYSVESRRSRTCIRKVFCGQQGGWQKQIEGSKAEMIRHKPTHLGYHDEPSLADAVGVPVGRP